VSPSLSVGGATGLQFHASNQPSGHHLYLLISASISNDPNYKNTR